jgi:sulfur transfer complex TusBCD TusB component (DsrH family)
LGYDLVLIGVGIYFVVQANAVNHLRLKAGKLYAARGIRNEIADEDIVVIVGERQMGQEVHKQTKVGSGGALLPE